jgi:hypothetical protein
MSYDNAIGSDENLPVTHHHEYVLNYLVDFLSPQ